jgi:hypothetical protein
MNLLKATLLLIVAGVLLHHMIWKVGGPVGMIVGLLLAGMFVIVAYFWFAMRD